MYIGKFLIFVIGLSVGVAAMLASGYIKHEEVSINTVSVATEESGAAAPASPFTVVDEPASATLESQVPVEVVQADTLVLLQRIEDAENRIEALESELAEVQSQRLIADDNLNEFEQAEVLSSVFEPATVSEIQSIRNNAQLRQLELRDRATREGWVNTDRFRQESREIRGFSRLRETLGDEGYDKLLAAEGRDNRVRIDNVIDNSAAALSGIEEGDLIIRYADERIFQFQDLRDATTEGERDELIDIQVSRNGEIIDLVIPRGPMGVTLDGVTEQPSP